MKLPSIAYLVEESLLAFKRFPNVILIAFIGTFTSIYIVHNESTSYIYNITNLILCLILGILALLPLNLISEKTKTNNKTKYLLHIPIFILITFYYFTLPTTKEEYNYITPELMKYTQYNLSLALLTTFITFSKKKENLGFWNFNFKLIERFIASGIYSGALFAGLSVALFSIDHLLEIKVPERLYADLWIFIVGIFNTVFFLADVPQNYEELEKESYYPKYLKFFSQYILLPIVVIYMAILYLYGLKIIINWDLPTGGVSNLILVCSGIGIGSFLALYPLQEKSENIWIKSFSKYFYIMLLPLIAMLFVAASRRISDYGITEPRYFLFVIDFWLLVTSLYFIFSKIKNIAIIPISLAILSFLTSVGPWSAYSVSYSSQMTRLERILVKNQILKDNTIIKKEYKIEEDDLYDISSILDYLNKYNKLKELKKYFKDDIKLDLYYNNPKVVMEAMGLPYVYPQRYNYEHSSSKKERRFLYYSVEYANNSYYDVSGYDFLLKSNNYFSNNNNLAIDLKNKTNEIKINDKKSYRIIAKEKSNLSIYRNEENLLDIDLTEKINYLAKKYPYNSYTVKKKELSINKENEKIKVNILFNSVNLTKEKDGNISIQNLVSEILIKEKDNEK